MHPFIDQRHRDAARARDEVTSLLDAYDPEQLAWRPAGERAWSLYQILDHLAMTAAGYHPLVRRLIVRLEQRDLTSERPYRPRPLARLILHLVGPDGRYPLPAPPSFRPGAAPGNRRDAGERWLHRQDELEELIAAADGLELNRLTLGSPVVPLIRFTLGESLHLLTAHTQRHLQQAERLRLRGDFPV